MRILICILCSPSGSKSPTIAILDACARRLIGEDADWTRWGWIQNDGYGIVVGSKSKTVTFYDENEDKTTIKLSTFLQIGSKW